jgi:type III secretion protein R
MQYHGAQFVKQISGQGIIALRFSLLSKTMRKIIVPVFLLFASISLAKSEFTQAIEQIEKGSLLKDPFYVLFLLIGISLLPFIAVMVTSFTKIVVVLSIARQALGMAQTPPNIVIMSLAMVLTFFSMYPVAMEINNNLRGEQDFKQHTAWLWHFWDAAKEPMRNFLEKRAQKQDQELFSSLLKEGNASEAIGEIHQTDFIVLAPAFLISELSIAFQIGFLVYLPFLVIDMTVANVLMALGMQMLSPTTISLPFKILLFVLVDGFRMLSLGLAKV